MYSKYDDKSEACLILENNWHDAKTEWPWMIDFWHPYTEHTDLLNISHYSVTLDTLTIYTHLLYVRVLAYDYWLQ